MIRLLSVGALSALVPDDCKLALPVDYAGVSVAATWQLTRLRRRDVDALAPGGAAPCGLWGEYPTDTAAILRCANVARSDRGFHDDLASAVAEAVLA